MVFEAPDRREIRIATALRGVAALSVAVHNFLHTGDRWDGWTPDAITLFVTQGHLFVDFFFLLSGFILSYMYWDQFSAGVDRARYTNFVRARFARIYPVHIVMILAFVLFEMARLFALSAGVTGIQPAFHSPFSITDLLMTLTFLQAFHPHNGYVVWNGPAWSIAAEWWVYLAFPWLVVWLSRIRSVVTADIFVLVIATATLSAIVWYYGSLDVGGLPGTVRCLALFCSGVCLYRIASLIRTNHANLLFLFGVVVVLLSMHGTLLDLVTVAGFALIVLSLLCADAPWINVLGSGPLHYLGKISYSLYMVHYWVIWLFVYVSNQTGLNIQQTEEPLMVLTYLSAFLLVSLTMAIVMFNLVEEPVRRLIRQKS